MKAAGLFIIGFLSGAIIAGGLVAWQYSQMFRQKYYMEILNNAYTANMVRAGLQEDMLKNMDNNIQQFVICANSLWGKDEKRLNAFWYVQRYYEKYNFPVWRDPQKLYHWGLEGIR